MRNSPDDNAADDSTGFGDLMMNCLIIFLFLMFFFMVNQGIRAVATRVDQDLLQNLMTAQQASMQEAANRVAKIADDRSRDRERTATEKKAMLAAQKEAQDAADAANANIKAVQADSEKQARALQGEILQLKEAISKARSAKSLRLDLCIDCTGSMQDAIERLKVTIASLMRTLPQTLTEVSIGVIAFRDGKLVDLPIDAVLPANSDMGVSVNRIQNFINRLTARGGKANIDSAIRFSMRRLTTYQDAPRECLVVIGDVSTREVSGGDQTLEHELLRDLRTWSQVVGKHRRVLALYTGASGSVDEKFFQSLGNANDHSTFSTQDSQLFELVLTAAFSAGETTP
ncbi:vWA domain-containing protein [Novipirellula rosea]|uniref:VWFA domain-containing protein n=1 Tax=Novipirellula rosea TaxID=1031540 RepID=A0ABP8NDI9_9BACT